MLLLAILFVYGLGCSRADNEAKLNRNDSTWNKHEARVQFMNTVRKFMNEVNVAVHEHNQLRRDLTQTKVNKFTHFIQRAINILNKYEDDELERFFNVFDDEVRKYHYRGCKFHELTENMNLRLFIAKILATIKNKPAAAIRRTTDNIAKKIQKADNNKVGKEIINFINSLYETDAEGKFEKFLINIDDYRLDTRKNMDIVPIIRDGVRSIIFDHYTHLNNSSRKQFLEKLPGYFKDFTVLLTLLKQYFASSSEEDVESLREITEQTTTEKTTIRQMYVQNNMDIKYDRFVYNHLTETTKRKKITQTSKKHKKHRRRKTKKPNNSNMEEDSGQTKTSRKRRRRTTTDEPRTYRQMYIVKNLELKYDPDAYKHLTTKKKRRIRKTKTTTPSSEREDESEGDAGTHRAMDRQLELKTLKPFVPWRAEKPEKFKYEIQLKTPPFHTREPQLHLKKAEFLVKMPGFYVNRGIGLMTG